MLKLNRVIETALYVDDLPRAREFYTRVLGLEAMLETEVLSAYDVGGESVLLLFKRGATRDTQVLPGGNGAPEGTIPPHDGSGPLHICFAIDADQLAAWETRLGERDVAIEGRTAWAKGGESFYFRDPDGHLLELMTPGNWANY